MSYKLLGSLPLSTEKTLHNSGSVEDMHHMVWRRQTNASNVIIRDSHHLLVQEAPEAVGALVFNLEKLTYPRLRRN